MKRIILFYLLFSLTFLCNAQSYLIEPIVYQPYSFSSGTSLILSDDNYSSIIPIGFDFCFFGISYNSLLISSNSYITFDLTSAGGYSPWSIVDTIPTTESNTPVNSIMAPWQDIMPPSGGSVRYALYGEAPCRKFVVSYSQVAMFSCTQMSFSNQIILYEGSNAIEIFIQNRPLCIAWNGGYAIEGLQNADGTEAVFIPGRNFPNQWSAYNDGYRFIPLTCGNDTNNCPFLIDGNYAIIQGKLFIDSMVNCTYDTEEISIANRLITLNPGYNYAFTDSLGDYRFYLLDTGNFQLSVNGPVYQQIVCTSTQFSVNSLYDTIDLDLPFENLQCAELTNQFDIPFWVRPCSSSVAFINLENIGTINSGNILLKVLHPIEFQVDSASYPYSVSGDTLIFSFVTGLQASETMIIEIYFTGSCDLEIGDFHCFYSIATISNQTCLNPVSTDIGCAFISNSIDPNDKRFSFGDSIAIDKYFYIDTISEEDSLVYMIRFQNTGNDFAYHVKIIDELPNELDISSFIMLSSSHHYNLSINNRTLVWDFNEINLPDSTSDPLHSIGFVKFKILQNNGNLPGTEIRNVASIYFDFNAPVITDTSVCIIALPIDPSYISVQDLINFKIYPNPSTGQITIAGNTKNGDRLQLIDITGRLLRSYTLNEKSTTFDIGEVAAGFYTFTITDSKNNLIGNRKIQLTE